MGLFMNAIAAALGQALVPPSDDPLLVQNYAVGAILAFCGGSIFWFQIHYLDQEEDELNALPQGVTNAENQDTVAAPKVAAALGMEPA
jgi:POT family proton-dependent oligopeptide transporter